MGRKKLLILDTFNFLHRAYHALPTTFRDPLGEPINAVYGVTSMIITVLNQIKPDYIIAAMDGPKPTFRVENFTAYKAQRKPMEEDFASQIPKTVEMMDAFEINHILVDGYEADDVIGTMVKKFSEEVDVVIVSNDRDLWQLVNGHTTIMVPSTKKGPTEWIGEKEVEARMGFGPKQIPDYKGLRGDPSDNIPGVHGVGDKTAKSLIDKFGTIEDIYKNIDDVEKKSLKEKLLNNYEEALMSKELAKIIIDVPVEVELKDCTFNGYEMAEVLEILERYHFKSLIKRLDLKEKSQESASMEEQGQLSLFK